VRAQVKSGEVPLVLEAAGDRVYGFGSEFQLSPASQARLVALAIAGCSPGCLRGVGASLARPPSTRINEG
jgi:hypothetical protein